MTNGSYDRRAPSASSQIVTLERLLESAEGSLEVVNDGYMRLQAENKEQAATIARLEDENVGLLAAAESLSLDALTKEES